MVPDKNVGKTSGLEAGSMALVLTEILGMIEIIEVLEIPEMTEMPEMPAGAMEIMETDL